MDKAELIKFADKVIDKYKAAAVDNLGYIAIHKYINVKDKRWAIDEECKALRCDFLKLLDADNESEAEYEKVADAYQNNIAPMTTIVRESILDWLGNMDADVIVWAIGEAVKNNVRTWRYDSGCRGKGARGNEKADIQARARGQEKAEGNGRSSEKMYRTAKGEREVGQGYSGVEGQPDGGGE